MSCGLVRRRSFLRQTVVAVDLEIDSEAEVEEELVEDVRLNAEGEQVVIEKERILVETFPESFPATWSLDTEASAEADEAGAEISISATRSLPTLTVFSIAA